MSEEVIKSVDTTTPIPEPRAPYRSCPQVKKPNKMQRKLRRRILDWEKNPRRSTKGTPYPAGLPAYVPGSLKRS